MPQDDIKVVKRVFRNETLLPEVVKMLDEGHTVTLRLRGYSMRPFLENDRDKALLTKAAGMKKGDPVLAEIAPGRYVLHRIIDIGNGFVTLLGDGNLTVERCREEDVKGSVIGFYRKGRDTLDRTDGIKWRVYSYVWMRLRPIRRYLLAFYRRIWLRLKRQLPGNDFSNKNKQQINNEDKKRI